MSRNRRLLLVNPPSRVYEQSRIRAGITCIPQVSLASLAAVGENCGYEVRVADLGISGEPDAGFDAVLREFRPTVAGLTVMTPHLPTAAELARRAKNACPGILTLAGGPHPSVLPRETLEDGSFDVAVLGEGEATLAELLRRPDDLGSIRGIAYRSGSTVHENPARDPVDDLDRLPLPAWHLFDLARYPASRLTSRRPPVGSLETSRGCPYRCIFCRPVFGRKVRYKSPSRVLAEIEHAVNCGIRELHVWDDHFTTDIRRAKEICRSIVDRGIRMPLNLFGGMRVDHVDRELMELMKRAGFYSVAMAPESGSEELLLEMKKGINLEDCRRAFEHAARAGLETIAYFMLGLPGETRETAEATIRFAKELSPTYAKLAFATPLPGTELMETLEADGRIRTADWSKFAFHNPRDAYDHPTLSWPELERLYRRFYNRFYLRPGYILRRALRGVRTGRIFHDAWYAARTWLTPGRF